MSGSAGGLSPTALLKTKARRMIPRVSLHEGAVDDDGHTPNKKPRAPCGTRDLQRQSATLAPALIELATNYFPNNFNAASAIFGAVRPCFT